MRARASRPTITAMPVELMYVDAREVEHDRLGLPDLPVGGVERRLGVAVDVARELDHRRPRLVVHARLQLSGRHPRHLLPG